VSSVVNTDDLPLLGESLALDTVNSLYGVEPEVIDFLDDARIRHWVEGVEALHQLPVTALDRRDAPQLRAVRDAARSIVNAALDGTRPPKRDIVVLNEAARQAPTVLALAWRAGGPARDATLVGRGDPPLAGQLAVAVIELVAGPDGRRVRRCARPACSMLFLQDHGHRRFCHPSCSHLMRQSRYRRKTGHAS
jgi:predicted RNA-binding Zn ribbon-like protein